MSFQPIHAIPSRKRQRKPHRKPHRTSPRPTRFTRARRTRSEPAPAHLEPIPQLPPVRLQGSSRQRKLRWGPMVRLGHFLQLQAAEGHRAAVVPLRPGLYLVAEVPERATRPELGVLPLLAPLVVRAATKALHQPMSLAKERVARALLPGPAPEPDTPTAAVGWLDPDDIAGVLEVE